MILQNSVRCNRQIKHSRDGAVQRLLCDPESMAGGQGRGVGLGWVSILSNDVLRDVLAIPEHVVPVAYLCLGYVNEFVAKPDLEASGWLPRLKLSDVVYFEAWNKRKEPGWEDMENMIKKNLDYA